MAYDIPLPTAGRFLEKHIPARLNKPTKRATLVIGTDLSSSFSGTNDVVQATPILLPVTTTRWRLRIANRSFPDGAIAGAITFTPIYKGTIALDNTGKWVGDFSPAPAQVAAAPTIPSDGSEGVTAWVTDPAAQFTADVTSGLSFGFNTVANQKFGFTPANIGQVRFGAGSSAQAGNAARTGGSLVAGAFLDVRLEIEYAGSNRIVLAIGDSTAAGNTDDPALASAVPSPHHTWPVSGCYRNRALCVNASIASKTYGDFTSAASYQLARFDFATTPPDDVILAMGINHANAGQNLATFQAAFLATLNVVKSFSPKRIFVTTVMPVPLFKAGALRATAAAGATSLVTDLPYAANAVVDIAYGTASYEQRTVSAASTAAATGGWTTTLTAATTNTQVAGATISLVAESRRQDFNKWIRTIPHGIAGIFEQEVPMRNPGGPTVGSADQSLFGVGDTHPGRAGYTRLAATVDLRSLQYEGS